MTLHNRARELQATHFPLDVLNHTHTARAIYSAAVVKHHVTGLLELVYKSIVVLASLLNLVISWDRYSLSLLKLQCIGGGFIQSYIVTL